MRFTIFQESRIGKRRTNQDRVAYSYTRDALLMVLADGMGGHLYGEVAAQISVQFIAQSFQQEARPKVTDPVLFLSRVLSNAHHAILDYAFDKHLADIPRTTIVACLIQEGVAHWAHAGDSRLYMIRKGRLVAQTRDHSRVQLMLDQGLLDAEAAAVHPGRNRIFSCLGGNHPPQIEFSRGVLLINGDVLAICSDGVWGPLDADTIVVNDGLIVAVGRYKDCDTDHANTVIDARQTCVAPGLIDSHVHPVFGDWTPRQNQIGWIDSTMNGGVTTMVSAGDVPDVMEMPDTWLSLYANNGMLESLEPYLAKWEHTAGLSERTLYRRIKALS